MKERLGPSIPPRFCAVMLGRTGKGKRMAECFVAKISEFKDGQRRVISHGRHEIGVFCDKDKFYAYSNFCLHQGGPACEGLIIAQVHEKIMEDMTSSGLKI